jgi:DNA-directed RNA polymerase II subunit RPB1
MRDVIEGVSHLCRSLNVVIGRDGLSVEAQRNATIMFHA